MKTFPSGGRRRMPCPSVPLPSLSSQHWHRCCGPSGPVLLWLGVFTIASSSPGFSVCLHGSVCAGSWFLSGLPCATALWKVVLCTWVTNIIWDRRFTLRDPASVKFLLYAGIVQGKLTTQKPQVISQEFTLFTYMDYPLKKTINFSLIFKAKTELTVVGFCFGFFSCFPYLMRHPRRQPRSQEWVQGSWGLILCGIPPSPSGSGFLSPSCRWVLGRQYRPGWRQILSHIQPPMKLQRSKFVSSYTVSAWMLKTSANLSTDMKKRDLCIVVNLI